MANPAPAANAPTEAEAPKEGQAPAAEAPAKPKKSPLAFIAGLSPREKTIGAVAAFFLLFFIVDLVMFKPLGRHLQSLTVKTREKEELIPKKLSVLGRKDEIEKVHGGFSGYLTDAKLSQEEEIAAYLGEIESVSQQVGLFISNINPVQTEEAGPAYYLKVDVEGAGSITNIKKFISSLEEANPAIRVAGFSLRGQGPTTNELRFRFSVVKLGLKKPAQA